MMVLLLLGARDGEGVHGGRICWLFFLSQFLIFFNHAIWHVWVKILCPWVHVGRLKRNPRGKNDEPQECPIQRTYISSAVECCVSSKTT